MTSRSAFIALLLTATAGGCKCSEEPHARRAAASVMVSHAGSVDAGDASLSDVLKAPRPQGGEHFGLYLMNKKVGFLFTDVSFVRGSTEKVQAVNQLVFRATVGSKVAERRHKEVRIYEAKPGGRLLYFTVEQTGDGGDQLLEATATKEGLRVVRKRPKQPNEVLNLPPSKETVEDADQARVALLRGQPVEGVITDGTDLEPYRVRTTLGESVTRPLGGVQLKLRRAVTLSEKEKVPVDSFFDPDGRLVEIQFGQTMRAVAEPERVARRLDQVEVFGLTRVVLPKPLPLSARSIPGAVTLTVEGLPEDFQKESARQKFRTLGTNRVEVSITAAPPKNTKRVLPLLDPNGGANLRATLAVEAKHPDIEALAKKLVAGEKNAYAAAKRINRWVYENVTKDYGASSDRATDVLRTKRGDCTEHSLLTVALMRAAGIPAKRIDGLVYLVNSDNVPAYYWHEWVEAYVGEWTQLDPTFGEDVADAAHLALGEEAGAEITPLIGQLKVLSAK